MRSSSEAFKEKLGSILESFKNTSHKHCLVLRSLIHEKGLQRGMTNVIGDSTLANSPLTVARILFAASSFRASLNEGINASNRVADCLASCTNGLNLDRTESSRGGMANLNLTWIFSLFSTACFTDRLRHSRISDRCGRTNRVP